MEIATATLVLGTDKPVKESGTYLRGFVGNRYRDRLLLHHHLEKSKSLRCNRKPYYFEPTVGLSVIFLIQYAKIIKNDNFKYIK
jgi:hypothetical protein